MIKSLYEPLFEALLRNESVRVETSQINSRSMLTQFYRYRDNLSAMMGGGFLNSRTIEFTTCQVDGSYTVIKLVTARAARTIKFETVSTNHEIIPTTVESNQSG